MSRIRALIGTGLIVSSITILAFTNPKEEDYLEHAISKIPTDYCLDILNMSPDQGNTLADNIINHLCSGRAFSLPSRSPIVQLFMQPAWETTVRYVIENQTQHRSYLLFSIYTTELPGQTYKSIGVLGQFIDLD